MTLILKFSFLLFGWKSSKWNLQQNKNFISPRWRTQRIAIARAIYRNSEIIIADEPTGNLDDENAINVLKIFKAFTTEGKTVIVVTHDKSKLEIFDKIVSIKEIKR